MEVGMNIESLKKYNKHFGSAQRNSRKKLCQDISDINTSAHLNRIFAKRNAHTNKDTQWITNNLYKFS